ncbi:metallophosphoesterase [Aquibacillus kalidii]|uniref:metallophosphoesterase n=1 Tax=Aquibacillus kalidii TaxID=2762597 RepID=UPI001648DB21|nr:metallophosphoesterase [Aquibacillus kalidii]
MYLVLAITLVIAVALVIYMVYNAYHDNIDSKNIQIGLSSTEPLKLFFISDVHTRIIREETIKACNKGIDLVVIGGDLVEKKVPLNRVRTNLTSLQAFNVPIYFIWGNNDYEKSVSQLQDLFNECNVTTIKNNAITFVHKQSSISLVGIDCCKIGNPDFNSAISKATGDYSILLSHDPSGFYGLTDQELEKINLGLSGHTHGGQIRLFGFGPYTRGGLKYYKSKPIFISEGYGFTKLPFRLGTQSECHILTIN